MTAKSPDTMQAIIFEEPGDESEPFPGQLHVAGTGYSSRKT